jgi:hypothetical protein
MLQLYDAYSSDLHGSAQLHSWLDLGRTLASDGAIYTRLGKLKSWA